MSPFSVQIAALGAAVLVLAPASEALAWGATGHRLIGQVAAGSLPDETPAFLRTPQAIGDIGELNREPDRWKASGKTHDTTRDPAHYVDIDDNGKILGGPALNALPTTRAEYETALRAAGTETYHAGYLPYSIIDGWQQLAKDFAYWRVLTAAIPREHDPQRKAWMERDLARREMLTVRDLGIWAHYVGDASQPMHVSVHYNGWGNYPNPHGYTQERVHAAFEGDYVRRNVNAEQVRTAMPPSSPCEEAIEVCTERYLAATVETVQPYFALQKAGGFVGDDPRGKAYVRARVAAGAAALRDFIITAWRTSANGSVGYPAVTVDQVVNGGVDPFDAIYGED
ncbi:MAG TPA: S1/P1 Nuclease [Caulobacteraceae bacterium]|jgi:hypothetical protein|nr:S1/P1 Nuclease [Caulobacteraceae bacterium]